MKHLISTIFLTTLFLLITVIYGAIAEGSFDSSSSKPTVIKFPEDNDQQQQELASDDGTGESSSGSGNVDKKSSSSNTIYIIICVIFLIIMLASLGLMIFCIRKYCMKKKELAAKTPLMKGMGLNGKSAGMLQPGGGPGAAGGRQVSAQTKSLSASGPKDIKINGKRPGASSVPTKVNAPSLAKKSASTTTVTKTIVSPLAITVKKLSAKSPSHSSTSTTTISTTTGAPATKKIPLPKKKNTTGTKKSERDVEPTQQSLEETQKSSHLEPIHEDEELELGNGKIIQKTFVCINGNDWHEPKTGETDDDFSFEIESGNTFSMLSN